MSSPEMDVIYAQLATVQRIGHYRDKQYCIKKTYD